jgi:hypothetical protein
MANVTGILITAMGGTLNAGNIDFCWNYTHGPIPHLRIRVYWKPRGQKTWKLLKAVENTGDYYYYPVIEGPSCTGGGASLHYPPPNPIDSSMQLKFVFDSCIPSITADTVETTWAACHP